MTNCNSTNGRCPTLNRKSFMAELRSLLAFLDAAERDRVLNRYERMFDEAGPEGETTVVRCFGSPVRQVLQIEREYREAVANGETPFADGYDAAEPERAEAPAEPEIMEEYAGMHIFSGETETETEEPLTEAAAKKQPEEALPAEDTEPAAEAAPAETEPEACLPEIDLDELDFSDLGLTFTKKPAAPEKEPEEGSIETPDEPAEDDEPAPAELVAMPEETLLAEPAEDEHFASPSEEAAEILPEEEPDELAEETPEEAETGETAEPEEAEMPEAPDEKESPADTEIAEDLPAEGEPSFDEPAEEAPAEEPAEEPAAEEEYEYEEIEERHPVPGGRAFAAVVVTIPMLAVWALLFGLSLALGVTVLGVGAALAVAGVYLAGYVFNGAIVRMPDLLLTAGTALAVFALALLLVWAGISLAVAGCTLTVRLTRSIYRSILYPKKEANGDE